MELARELDDEDGPVNESVSESELLIGRIEKKTQHLINQIEKYKKSKECDDCDSEYRNRKISH